AEESVLARSVRRELLRVGGDNVRDDSLDLARVAHLREPLLFDDLRSALARLEHLGEHVLALLAADAPLVYRADERAEFFGRDGRGIRREARGVELTQQLAFEPVGRAARVRGRRRRALIEVRERAVARQKRGVVEGEF